MTAPQLHRTKQSGSTGETPVLKGDPWLEATHEDSASLAQRSVVSIVLAKTPHRTELARPHASPITPRSGRGRDASCQSNALGTARVSKSPRVYSGCSTPRSSLLAPEREKEAAARVMFDYPLTRVQTLELYRSSCSSTGGRAASLGCASACVKEGGGRFHGSHATRRCVRSSQSTFVRAHPLHTDPSADARLYPCRSSDAMIAEPQGSAISDSTSSHDASSSYATSPVLHRNGSWSVGAASLHPSCLTGVTASTAPTSENYRDVTCGVSTLQTSTSATSIGAATHRGPEGSAALDRPWLTTTPARSILKRGGRMKMTTSVAASSVSSTHPSISLCETLTQLGDLETGLVGAPADLLSSSENISASPLARLSRHVTFDEAAVEYGDDSAEDIEESDNQSGLPSGCGKRGSAMLSPCARNGLRRRLLSTGTTGSMSKTGADNWGANSEWFNKEFGAHLRPLTAAAIEPATMSSGALMSPRGTPREYGVAGHKRDNYATLKCNVLSTPVFLARSRTPQGTRAVMNPHFASILSVAAASVSGCRVTVSDASDLISGNGCDSAPVLVHQPSSLTSTYSSNECVVASSCQTGVHAPPPPPSIGDLRRRSSAVPSCLSTSAVMSSYRGPGGPCHGGSSPRPSSPSVPLSQIEAALAGGVQGVLSTKQRALLVPPLAQAPAADQSCGESSTVGTIRPPLWEARSPRAAKLTTERQFRADGAASVSGAANWANTKAASRIISSAAPRRALSNEVDCVLNGNASLTSGSVGGRVVRARGETRGNVSPAKGRRHLLKVGSPSPPSVTTRRCSRISQTVTVPEAGATDTRVPTGAFSGQPSRCSTKASRTVSAATCSLCGAHGGITVPSADATHGVVVPPLATPTVPVLSGCGGVVSQESWKNATATNPSLGLVDATEELSTYTSVAQSLRVNLSVSQPSHHQLADCDDDEGEDDDESEPHIQIPIPAPTISGRGKLN